jgi:threonine/homoserine/homoserine lactone efflux protein
MLPVDPAVLGGYLVAATAIVVSPGPDTMLILRYTLTSGHRVGLATVAGVQLGLVAHTLAAVLGLSLLILSMPMLFRAIAVVGAGYLGWLGVQSFRAGVTTMAVDGAKVGAIKAARDAIICNLLNPKVIVLFLALMPGFLRPERGSVPAQLATLGLVLILVNTAWQLGITTAAEAARRWLANPRVQRAVSAVTGVVLLGFAVLMVVEHGLG